MEKFNIQINKTSVNSVLFIVNIGTTHSATAYLISVLTKIAEELHENITDMTQAEKENHDQKVKRLTHNLPKLPDFSSFHTYYKKNQKEVYGDIRTAFFDAFSDEKCEYLKLDGSLSSAFKCGKPLVSACFIIPYPPGFPILVPGQIITEGIIDYLKNLDVKEIHGYRADLGLRIFSENFLQA